MSRPIKDTPILTGEDAKRFRESLRRQILEMTRELTPEEKEVRDKETERMNKAYHLMCTISNGQFH
jgi:hypothetical protein